MSLSEPQCESVMTGQGQIFTPEEENNAALSLKPLPNIFVHDIIYNSVADYKSSRVGVG